MSKRNKKLTIIISLLCLILVILCLSNPIGSNELKSIKSEKELENFYSMNQYRDLTFLEKVLLLPFSIGENGIFYDDYYSGAGRVYTNEALKSDDINGDIQSDAAIDDYSKTNIQVEGVDEADIVKTDGKYTYSISGNDVIITDASDKENLKIDARISLNTVPMDLILFNDKLVIISSNRDGRYTRYGNDSTTVSIYDIKNKIKIVKLKSFELMEPYYTSRCTNGKLYVISNGYLQKENDKIQTEYKENNLTKNIPLSHIKYLNDIKTNKQTLIAEVDLNDLNKDIDLNSYLIDMSNAYVSQNNMYLLNTEYNYYSSYIPKVRDLFGIKGVFGLANPNRNDDSYGKQTQIYKFNITENGIKYSVKRKIKGTTINQYSMDEKNDHLRLGLETEDGSKIVVLDEYLNNLGSTDPLAKGERMYTTRFMDNKAYLVTYKNTDPLFVVDLSDETNPKTLGELHIPGYSNYLHPYDDTHLIGIGMETEEKVERDSFGRVTFTRVIVKGMKMSLFDVSDVNNPKQIANTVIGDSRTISSVLTNPKALLFSKEKKLIAVPVNNYSSDLEAPTSDEYEDQTNFFRNKSKERTSEGYFVYNIDLDTGFNLKGTITHEKEKQNDDYYYGYSSKLLRGLYIGDNLITLSEDEIKVNKLDTLEELSTLKLGEEN